MPEKCAWSGCDDPYSEHDNFKRMVHNENALYKDQPLGNNGGVPCDTKSGPCNCGAWH